MLKNTPITIVSGLPFEIQFQAILPTGRTWWNSLEDFEVRSDIRETSDYTSDLILDLLQFMTVTFDDVDTVTIDLVMSGEDTRKLLKAGFFDVILSDVGGTDSRAFRIAKGNVSRQVITTAPKEETT